jgi:hypothetical protein
MKLPQHLHFHPIASLALGSNILLDNIHVNHPEKLKIAIQQLYLRI